MKDRTREIIVEITPTVLVAAVLVAGVILYNRGFEKSDELCRHFFSNSETAGLENTCFWIQSSALSVFSYVSVMIVPILIVIASTSFSNRHKLSKLEKELKKLKEDLNV